MKKVVYLGLYREKFEYSNIEDLVKKNTKSKDHKSIKKVHIEQ